MRVPQKLLVTEEEARSMLSLEAVDFEWLVSTAQLAPIKIRGQKLFEVSQLEQLIGVYKIVQTRGTQDGKDQRS